MSKTKEMAVQALNVPEELENIIVPASATEQNIRETYEPGQFKLICSMLKEKLVAGIPPYYIEFKTRDPSSGKVIDIRGYVTPQNIKYLPRLIIHARSDIRIYNLSGANA